MTKRIAADRELLALARTLENLAYKMPVVDGVIAERFRDLDAWKARTLGDGMPHGNDLNRPVERCVDQRLEIVDDLAMFATRMEQIRVHVAALNAMGDQALRGQAWLPVPAICACAGHEGAKVEWIPGRSLDDGNGWADPKCHDIAEEGGLCLRCSRRKQRYCAHHGLHFATTVAEAIASVEVAA